CYVLGLKVERDREQKILKISQSAYAIKILDRFGMLECRPIETPVAIGATLEPHNGTAVDYPFSQAIGSLMYLVMGTRPDPAHGVGLVSRFASNPGEQHVKAVKRIFRYLRATMDMGVEFGGGGEDSLVGYADADFAGCVAMTGTPSACQDTE